MSRLTGWWSRRGNAAKVELYTRWSFHFFAVVEIASIGLVPVAEAGDDPAATPLGLALALTLLVCAHAVLNAVLSSRALDWVLDRRDRPVRLAAAQIALTAAGALAVIVLRATGALEAAESAVSVVVGMVSFTLSGLVLCVRRTRRMLYVVPGTALVTGAATALAGLHPAEGLGSAVAITVGGYFLVAACGFSAWLMKIVWELERSRDLKARLAVAEERLRFGRDLHDILGRNLSVIALKSELAVQLARRERPEAVDQMTEVQRIARESQRELRDVVRGYREADLRVELEGARGVLDAAGIACEVTSDVPALPDEVQAALGWVVRETTTNVLRHGDARRCAIAVREEGGAVVLTVENDGVERAGGGGAATRTGSGLAGLRERIAAVGGSLDAGPGGDGTFRVAARIPLPPPTRPGGHRVPEARAETRAETWAGARTETRTEGER
ncbi:sensor histidine kinase [Streptomyces sp. NPDC056144]|uniref:sensor histidine kinase n=1 Tax=unclassified Streptomyces TaxID=2593676 RepID=UPI0035E052AD